MSVFISRGESLLFAKESREIIASLDRSYDPQGIACILAVALGRILKLSSDQERSIADALEIIRSVMTSGDDEP
jgi:hypothetical protein